MLDYSNIKLISTTSVIKTESPYMHFDIKVDFTVFVPQKDEILGKESEMDSFFLVGVVTKVSPDHIACSVYGLFTASIPAREFPSSTWTWDNDIHVWSTFSKNGIKYFLSN